MEGTLVKLWAAVPTFAGRGSDPRRLRLVPAPALSESSLPFGRWVDVLVASIREVLPEITATRKRRKVTIRYGKRMRVVTASDEGGKYWVRTYDAGAPVATVCDADRHDEYTARAFARMIADGYDMSLLRSVPR